MREVPKSGPLVLKGGQLTPLTPLATGLDCGSSFKPVVTDIPL